MRSLTEEWKVVNTMSYPRADLLRKMCKCYPKTSVEVETIEVYLTLLKDLSDEMFAYAITKCMVSNKFFPTIAEIREAAMEYSNKVSDDPIPAWADVESEIRLAMSKYGVADAVPWSCPMVAALMRNRWRLYCEMQCSQEGTVYAQTRMAYESMVKQKAYDANRRAVLRMIPESASSKLQRGKLDKAISGLATKLDIAKKPKKAVAE